MLISGAIDELSPSSASYLRSRHGLGAEDGFCLSRETVCVCPELAPLSIHKVLGVEDMRRGQSSHCAFQLSLHVLPTRL